MHSTLSLLYTWYRFPHVVQIITLRIPRDDTEPRESVCLRPSRTTFVPNLPPLQNTTSLRNLLSPLSHLRPPSQASAVIFHAVHSTAVRPSPARRDTNPANHPRSPAPTRRLPCQPRFGFPGTLHGQHFVPCNQRRISSSPFRAFVTAAQPLRHVLH